MKRVYANEIALIYDNTGDYITSDISDIKVYSESPHYQLEGYRRVNGVVTYFFKYLG